MDSSPRSRRWLPWLVAALAVVAVAAVAAYVVLHGRPGDVSNPNVEFKPQQSAKKPVRQPTSPSDPRFEWPVYGYDKARTRYFPMERPLHPPYRQAWKRGSSILLEFTPVMSVRSLFYLKNNGALVALSRKSGRTLWKRKLGYLAASSPAVSHNTVYVVLLKRYKGSKGGRVVAVSAKDGRTRWSRKLPSRSESSPLLHRGTLYFGSEDGTVYALRSRDGYVRWRYKASGAVKGGLAKDDSGRLFFGDYGGNVHAVRATNGHRIWKVGTSGAKLGLGSGQFYSTPAAAYGRVYLGNTDGFVYSYAADSGKLAWRTHTNGYVYGSPAVAQVPGGRPTVYIGSYDQRFYALDARTGRKRWVRKAGGKISGGAVVLGDMVWFATLNHRTVALGARTGQTLYTTRKGQFNPVVSDGARIYLMGTTSIYALAPRKGTGAPQRAKTPRRRFRLPRRAVVCFSRGGKKGAKQISRPRRPVVCFVLRGRLICHAKKVKKAARVRPRRLPLDATVCFRSHGRANGRRICRPRKPRVCFRLKDGKRRCHIKRGKARKR